MRCSPGRRRRKPPARIVSSRSRLAWLSRAGFVLVIVLVVIAVLALAAYTFSELMLSHQQAAQLSGMQLQARSLVDSGADSVRVFLIQDKATREEAGGVFNNPDKFRGVVVMPDDEPRDRGSFTVIAPKLDDDGNPGGVRYGLEDESTRLNLNSLVFIDNQPSTSALASGAQALGALTGGGGAAGGAGGGGAAGVSGRPSNSGGGTNSGGTGTGQGNSGGANGGGNTGGAAALLGSGGLGSLGGALGGAGAGGAGGSSGGSESGGNGRKLLLALPGMTNDIADAILDWLDDDDEPREYGCEREHYAGLTPPYAPKNGPFETVEELLLVRGVTPQLLFGRDVNRNGMIDQQEQQLEAPAGGESGGSMDRGWSAYLTLFSQERNVNAQGQPRIFVNQQDLQQLHTELSAVFSEEWANFIVLLRQNGPGQQQSNVTVGGGGNKSPMKAADVQMDLTKQPQYQLTQVLDLIDAQVSVTPSGGAATTIKSPFTSELLGMGIYMPALMDNLSVSQAKTIPGRININQATRLILEGVPGITPEIVNEIISRRDLSISKGNPNRNHETWILAEGIATLTEMKLLTPFLCGGGDVYRAQVVGYFQGGSAASRAEVVFDATKAAPRLLLWRDMSHLGRGYALETLGVDLSGP